MAVSFYITHPEVRVDPATPVPDWGLSERGQSRADAFAARDLLPADAVYVSSEETKAKELAAILAMRRGNRVFGRDALGENDRSSTGFLPPKEFERQANLFFANPSESTRGWETAIAAQTRIVSAVTLALAELGPDRPLVFVGHGGVGTLLKCHIGGLDISRSEDQGKKAHPGGGNLYAFDLAERQLLCDWTAMENWEGLNNG